ncbi:MAG: DUF115 domain-containing protein [Dehalococcoidales bacterium]|jgi:hypothetical protein|nr:DUF115 domain-containing protein [Dehalococcoidales bacterium]
MKLNEWAGMQEDIGLIGVLDTLCNEQGRINAILHSNVTVKGELENWLNNFAYNIRKFERKNKWLPPDAIKGSAIVVGAGPSITDEQIMVLRNYPGTIICTNKSLKRCYAHHVAPKFVTVVHPTDEILPHFAHQVVRDNLYMSNVVLSTMTHPSVTDEILAHADPDKVFWYNPSTSDMFVENIDKTISLLSNRGTIDTGGNVGIFSMLLAYQWGANPVGILGLEHCHGPGSWAMWTNEQSDGYEWHYAPEDDMLYCITPMFKSYLHGMMQWYSDVRELRPDFDVINLTKMGVMYTRRRPERTKDGMPYMDVKDFVARYS